MLAAAASHAGGAAPEGLHRQAIAMAGPQIDGIQDTSMAAIRTPQQDSAALRSQSQHRRRDAARCRSRRLHRALFFFLDCPDSDKAIAIACLRLFTFFPALVLSLPSFCSCITFSTLFFCLAVAMASLPCCVLEQVTEKNVGCSTGPRRSGVIHRQRRR